MASKSALLLYFNLLFFTVVTSTYVPCTAPPLKSPDHSPIPTKPPSPSSFPPPVPAMPPSPFSPPRGNETSCPMDALKLWVCTNVLSLVNIQVGDPAKTLCCSLLGGLVDLEATVCLCAALKANMLGINLNIPISLSLLLNYCGKSIPSGFQCA